MLELKDNYDISRGKLYATRVGEMCSPMGVDYKQWVDGYLAKPLLKK